MWHSNCDQFKKNPIKWVSERVSELESEWVDCIISCVERLHDFCVFFWRLHDFFVERWRDFLVQRLRAFLAKRLNVFFWERLRDLKKVSHLLSRCQVDFTKICHYYFRPYCYCRYRHYYYCHYYYCHCHYCHYYYCHY